MNNPKQNLQHYKGVSYKVMRSSFGTVNAVVVFFGGQTHSFETIQTAKRFISNLA